MNRRQPPLQPARPSRSVERLPWIPGEWRLVELGHKVRSLRVARGLTRGDLARPYSRAFVELLEAGRLAPTARALDSIAARLGVERIELLRPQRPPDRRRQPGIYDDA